MRIPLRYQTAQKLRSFGAFPQMLISDSERAWCLFCAGLTARRHQLFACRTAMPGCWINGPTPLGSLLWADCGRRGRTIQPGSPATRNLSRVKIGKSANVR